VRTRSDVPKHHKIEIARRLLFLHIQRKVAVWINAGRVRVLAPHPRDDWHSHYGEAQWISWEHAGRLVGMEGYGDA
jgi:hypothetical protein